MALTRLLVANRGEIAVRILRTAAAMGIESVAVYSADDDRCLHVRRADHAVALRGHGPAAYLDGAALVAVAGDHGCDAIHPGYGFLSENAAFAAACEEAGLRFVGPSADTLRVLGDKSAARGLAERCAVPVLPGTGRIDDPAAAQAFFADLGDGAAVMVKAIAGGGGRGMRAVTSAGELEAALRRCRAEALAAFGIGDIYLEKLLVAPRHIEVQIVGDGSGRCVPLGERDCSIQRRHQKLIEIAPAPRIPGTLRAALIDAALRMAQHLSYRSAGTFEFLIDTGSGSFYFIEANPRLQVEHTVTEEISGIDLVAVQLRIAAGATLADIGLATPPPLRGTALQMRVNTETVDRDGGVRPSRGTLRAFDIPSGHGVRTDTAGYTGYSPNPNFDSLVAKVVVHSDDSDFATAVRKAQRALRELRIDGVETNQAYLDRILSHPDFAAARFHTDFAASCTAGPDDGVAPLFFSADAPVPGRTTVGARVDAGDPLAVLEHGKTQSTDADGGPAADVGAVVAQLQGTVVSVEVEAGHRVVAGQEIIVLEAMKMHHVVAAERAGVIRAVYVAPGDTVAEGQPLFALDGSADDTAAAGPCAAVDLDAIRPDLEEARRRHDIGLDAARVEAVERRHASGRRTARENIADLCDAGSFVEYGALVIAAQRRRRPVEELIERTPADGLVAGIGRVNGEMFGADASQCVVTSYDYTVLAGTQGLQNHRKKDRMFELAAERRLPVVLFAEGGGGRPGDTDGTGVTGLDCMAFRLFAELSGLVPLVGITTGRCFAGNAALLGCCDVVIATRGSNIGMGGPAMVEGGGLGVFRPEEIGPLAVHERNGVVDLAVADEAEAVAFARRYLAYFQGDLAQWECADQRHLRHVVPDDRLRIYDVRAAVTAIADTGSVLELRSGFAPGMVTALARVEGRAVGIVANNPVHLAGAIDSDGADKAARFMQLCDAFDLPMVFLCDTPGIMVGPEIEKTALVRHAARMFLTGASLTVPFCTIVLRKGYGLGAQAMAGGSFKSPHFTVAWPSGEFGGMGLEGAVKLGFRRELAAVADRAERQALFQQMVDRMYEVGKAVNIASSFEIDDVIDPADTRRWIASILPRGPRATRTVKKRPLVDSW